MTVEINGRTETLDGETLSVVELLNQKKIIMPEHVSVQLNGDILERTTFGTTTVNEGDKVELLYFVGGG